MSEVNVCAVKSYDPISKLPVAVIPAVVNEVIVVAAIVPPST